MKKKFLPLCLMIFCFLILMRAFAAKEINISDFEDIKTKKQSVQNELEKIQELTVEQIAELEKEDNFVFDPFGKRDPFEPPLSVRDVNIPNLERFPLDAFKITGILWDSKAPKVVIKDPSGKQTIASINTKIGINHGYIRVIREGEIVVIENIYEDGQFTKKAQVLGLNKLEVVK